jgi:hypothetical protein
MARFNNQPARRQYSYTVTLEGYQPVNDSLFLEIDTAVTVTLTLATGQKAYAEPEVTLYPNPATDKLYIPAASEGTGILFNPEGKILIERKLEAGLNTFDVAHLPPGLYILRIKTENRKAYRKVIIN